MTHKLYETSPELREWTTRITGSRSQQDGSYVMLEETAFYPHGGGQPCDLGTIAGIQVLDVVSEGSEIWHKIEKLPEAEEVDCAIDWNRRFDHMQQHSGQHLLSAVCLSELHASTLSFHLGTEYATIDIAKQELSREELSRLELAVNRVIYQNHAIISYTVSEEEAARLPLVKAPTVSNPIRIVEIESIEYNACGGTHVSSTGALGMIKLLKAEKQKGNQRIYFVCGYRALAEFDHSQQILNTIAMKFNTGKDEVINRLDKWEQDFRHLQAELTRLQAINTSYMTKELLANVANGVLEHHFEDMPLKELQQLATSLATEARKPFIILSSHSDLKAVLAYAGDQPFACGAFIKEYVGKFQGKGGGNHAMAQASFSSLSDLVAFCEFANTYIQSL